MGERMEAVSAPYFLLEGLSKPLETPISRPKKMDVIPPPHLANSRLASCTHCDA